jgi:hypothetical protein
MRIEGHTACRQFGDTAWPNELLPLSTRLGAAAYAEVTRHAMGAKIRVMVERRQ